MYTPYVPTVASLYAYMFPAEGAESVASASASVHTVVDHREPDLERGALLTPPAPAPALPIAVPARARLGRLVPTFHIHSGVPVHLAVNAGDVCPITQVALAEIARVHVAEDGYAYDHEALQEWMQRSNLSPMTREPMPQTSRDMLGLTGAARRKLRHTGAYLSTPQGGAMTVTVAAFVAGLVTPPVAMLVHNAQQGYQFAPILIALSAPAGGTVLGALTFCVALPVCRVAQRRAYNREVLEMRDLTMRADAASQA